MDAVYVGWLSILPPMIAIILALITKEVLFSLIAGVLSGTLIYSIASGMNPIVGPVSTVFDVMIQKTDMNIIIFCFLLGGLVYLINASGGAQAYGKWASKIIRTKRSSLLLTESTVTFSAKDYKNQGLWKEITISGEEFIRRFLMHVPPKRFVRIRHYGLLSSRNKKKKITLCRNILGCKKYISKLKDMDAPAIIRLLYNKDICKCSSCGGKIIPLPTEQHFIKPKPHMLC